MKYKKHFLGILILCFMLFLILIKDGSLINLPGSQLRESFLNGGRIPDGVINADQSYDDKDKEYNYKKDATIVNKDVLELETVEILGHPQRFSVLASYGPNPCSAIYQGGHAYYSLRFYPYFTNEDRYVYAPKIINYWVEFRDDDGRTLIRFEGSKRFDASTDGVWIYELYDPSEFKDKIGTGRFRMYYEIWFDTSDPNKVIIFDLMTFTNKAKRIEIANSFLNKISLLASRAGKGSSSGGSSGVISGSACMGISGAGGKGSGGGDDNGGCPVNIATGVLVEDYVDLAYPSGYAISRHYNSGVGYNPGRCFGWMFNFEEFLRFDLKDGSINYRDSRFIEYRFVKDSAGYSAAKSWNFLKMHKERGNYVITFPDQSKKVFNCWGYLIKDIDPQGNETSYSWRLSASTIFRDYSDISGMPLDIVALLGPASGQRKGLIITDPYSRRISVSFDVNGQVSKIEDWAGRITEYAWNNFFMMSYKDAGGGLTTFEYRDGIYVRIKSIKYPNGARVWNEYFGVEPPNSMIVRRQQLDNGGYINYTYGWIAISGGRDAAKTDTWKSNPNNLWTQIDESGRKVKYYYDENSNIIKTEEPGSNGQTVSYLFTYSPATSLMTSKKDPLGRTTRYYYDQNGNLTKLVRPDNEEIRLVYNDRNYPTDYYDASGRHASFNYDLKNNLTSYIDKNEKRWDYDYNAMGKLTRITDANGHSWRYEYDYYGNITAITDEEGGYIFARYNDVGMPIFVNINGLKYEYSYNNFNKITKIKDAKGNVTSFTYDGNSNLTSATDAENNTINMTYDVFNLLRRVENINNNSVNTLAYFEYNHNNKLSMIKDSSYRNIEFGYSSNSADKIISKKNQTEGFTYYNYDSAGNMVEKNIPKFGMVQYRYDSLNRLIRKIGDYTAYYDWDKNNNLIKTIDETGSTEYEYDLMGRVLKKSYPFKNKSTEQRYDNVGNLIYKKNFAGDEIYFEYDKANKVKSISKKDEKSLNIIYSNHRNPARVEYPNGVNLFISFDDLKNITRMKYLSANGEIIYMVEYEYDKLSRVIRKKSSGLNRNTKDLTYVYDKALGMLKEVKLMDKTLSSYSYDKNGNRVMSQTPIGSANYYYDGANHMLGLNNTSYEYDAAENLIMADEGSRKKIYTYDRFNNLKKVEFENQGHSNYEEYSYDNATRLRTIKYFSNTKERTYTLWMGNKLEGEITNSGRVIFANYGYGFRNSQGDYYYIIDAQSSVVGVTDKEGDVAAVYEYDEFGNPLTAITEMQKTQAAQDQPASSQPSSQQETVKRDNKFTRFLKNIFETFKKSFFAPKTPKIETPPKGSTVMSPQDKNLSSSSPPPLPGPGSVPQQTPAQGSPAVQTSSFVNKVESPLRYAGYYYDEDSELYYLQSRYYDPKIGRFTQADKIGYAAGLNLYAYCTNDPVNYIDPMGTILIAFPPIIEANPVAPTIPILSEQAPINPVSAASGGGRWWNMFGRPKFTPPENPGSSGTSGVSVPTKGGIADISAGPALPGEPGSIIDVIGSGVGPVNPTAGANSPNSTTSCKKSGGSIGDRMIDELQDWLDWWNGEGKYTNPGA